MRYLPFFLILAVAAAIALGSSILAETVPVVDDPLLRMPGTQPADGVSLETPGRCMNCHEGYNPEVEPGFNWKGSMMAQASRDFLFWACFTVAGQDAQWAVNSTNALDLCERCHFPKGWLEGRSDPTNASAMIGGDYDGVQCDFCHRLYDPFFETTFNGEREGSDWLNFWDETNASDTPSQAAANNTYTQDALEAQPSQTFNGESFFLNNLPPVNYQENASGQFFVSTDAAKRAPFADAAARHQMFYSRYHKSKYFCATCHDVSNPILANLGADPNALLPTELNSAHSFYHVERTFSEFMLSAYGQQGGAPTNVEFQQQGAPDITHVSTCQDCHMRDVVGVGANKKGVPVRPTESIEHPQSGQPLHDMTGGNAWVSYVLASAVPGAPNYDATNDALLNQGAATLTLDMTLGEGIDPVALLAGSERAKQQLLLAATIKNLSYDATTGALSFRVQNNTGHKLISGFPEGRRIYVNIKAYAAGSLLYEINPYDEIAGTLKGLDYPYQPDPNGLLPLPQGIGDQEAYVDTLVYETHPESSLTGESHSFHFALATSRHKDNRIPPKGFDIANADKRLSVPVYYDGGVDIGATYYTAAENAGGYDDVALTIPVGADAVEVTLYYQTTSREYIEFLRDEINGTGNLTLPTTPGVAGPGDPDNYIIQSDAFFTQLSAWGDTIWQLWTHNMNIDGARPFQVAQASVGAPPAECDIEEPTLLTAISGNAEVTLEWSTVSDATGYRVFYDLAGKAQLIADAGNTTSYTDTGLTNGIDYCYVVTAYTTECESEFSHILCATPNNQGQQMDSAGINSLETGLYGGKGKNITFTPQATFTPGDQITFRAYIIDAITGAPLENATAELLITGPESLTVTTDASTVDGVAEATWQTKTANKKNPGTASGAYTVQTKNVTATGYQWDGVLTDSAFSLQ